MLFSIFNTAFNTFVEDLQFISIRPSRTNHACKEALKEVSLTIFKGSNIKSQDYIGVSKTIQKIGLEKGLCIDIKIPHYPFAKTTHSFEKEIPSFAIGHSSGAYDFLLNHNISKYDGFIQIGSVLNSNGKLPWKKQSLGDFPIPVLTLIGNKDGYLRYLYCLDEQYAQNDTEKYVTKPIIIMNNITHLHFSNTSSSKIANILGLKDMKSPISSQTAWNILAYCIIDFIILNSNNTSYNTSLDNMKEKYDETNKLLSSYTKFDNVDNLKGLLSILHMSLNKLSYNDVYYNNYFDFLSSKPTDNSIHFYKEKKLLSKMYFTPLWIKTKYNVYISTRKINKYLFQKIMNNYSYNTQMKIVFQPDRVCHTTLEWIMTDLTINRKNDTIYIKSPIFITKDDALIYSNYYYFKMLSPAQIFELINIDLQDF